MINLNRFLTLILFLILFAAIFKIFLKFLPLLLIFVIILSIPYQKMLKKLSNLFIKKQGLDSVTGKVYKQCNYCQKRADRKALSCDFCGKPFE